MTNSFDLEILPLFRYTGKEPSSFAELFIANPSRRSARGRRSDRLILHLKLEGNAPLSPDLQLKILERLARNFYKTSGSVTAAMKVLAGALNQYLLDRNLRNAGKGLQAVGIFTMLVFRTNRVYMAQSGPSHAYQISNESVEHFHDPQLSGRGLGLSRATTLRFFQIDVSANDILLISHKPNPKWSQSFLQDLHGLGKKVLSQHLFDPSEMQAKALLILVKPGKGKVNLLESDEINKLSPKVTPVSTDISGAVVTGSLIPPPQIEEDKKKVEDVRQFSESKMPDSSGRLSPLKRLNGKMLVPMLEALGRAFGNTFRQVAQSLSILIKRMLPDESLFTIPTYAMAFMAIVMPLVVVTVASIFYFRRGREIQYQDYFFKAQNAAIQAVGIEDPNKLRVSWGVTLYYLDKAESYQTTDDSQSLRFHAQSVLDGLDAIERLDFQQAIIGGLASKVQITRMVAENDDELFLLNSTDGNVFRAIRSGGYFKIDPSFICGPIPQPIIVGFIIDIVALPKGNNLKSSILGMDANGNVLACNSRGEPPLAFQLATPAINWGTPKAFTMDSGDLYVLDPQTNAVWIFWENDLYREQPRLFFGKQIPSVLDVVDLAVSGDDLFLLHDDGLMTKCTYSFLEGSPTRCFDPAEYTDYRPGRESGPLMLGASFNEILYTPPPDPSIYMLDSEAQSIYHFSLRLSFQRQYRSQNILPDEPVSSFAISPNRIAFFAVGNQVYSAVLP